MGWRARKRLKDVIIMCKAHSKVHYIHYMILKCGDIEKRRLN